MERPEISQDDLQDVMEMTNKMETYILRTTKDQEKNLSMSAIMSATINAMLAQCETIYEVHHYRNIFIQILDSTIRNIKIKDKK